MKRPGPLVLVGVTSVLGLAAVLVVRAQTLVSRQPEVGAPTRQPLDEVAAARRLARALTFPTYADEEGRPATEALRAFQAFLESSFPLVHTRLELERVNELTLLFTWKGSRPELEPVLLLAHQDVVPADGAEWTHPPFSGYVDDAYVWGRGALDDKASLLGILEALEGLLAEGHRPARTLLVAFGHDEELGGTEGAAAAAELLRRRGTRLALVLDEGGFAMDGSVLGSARPLALIGIAEKGWLDLELSASGAGGHSSMPPASTPIGRLSRALARVEDHPFPPRLDGAARAMLGFLAPEMPFARRLVLGNLWLFGPLVERSLDASPGSAAMLRTTIAPTVLRAGERSNVLPREATATVNFRILPGDDSRDVIQRVRDVIDDPSIELAPRGRVSEPSPMSDPDSPAFRLVARLVRETRGSDVLAVPFLVLGGTDSRHFTELADEVLRFVPIHLGPEGPERIHGVDERVGVEDYGDCIRYYRGLVRALDELP